MEIDFIVVELILHGVLCFVLSFIVLLVSTVLLDFYDMREEEEL